jgi:hypothetical protein
MTSSWQFVDAAAAVFKADSDEWSETLRHGLLGLRSVPTERAAVMHRGDSSEHFKRNAPDARGCGSCACKFQGAVVASGLVNFGQRMIVSKNHFSSGE